MGHFITFLAQGTDPRTNFPKPEMPGAGEMQGFQELADSLAFAGLLACLAAILVSTIIWNLGSRTHNEEQVFNAKRGAIAGVLAAFLIGALPVTIDYFTDQGKRIGSPSKEGGLASRDGKCPGPMRCQ